MTVDMIRKLKNLSMKAFESEVWRLIGSRHIKEADRRKVSLYFWQILIFVIDMLESGKLQRIVLVIMSKATSEVLERWNFSIETDKEVVEKG